MRRRSLIFGFILLSVAPSLVLADTTSVTLRADALEKGYTVVHSTGTVWLGVQKRSIRQTKEVRVKIARVNHPERFPSLDEPLSDLYRYSLHSNKPFKLKKTLRVRMAYQGINAETPKVLKYWDASTQRWRRLKTLHDNPSSLVIGGQLRRKQAIIAVFPKAKSVDDSAGVVQGLASWYDWTGAACNDFPLGSVIRVTNVSTGATVDSTVVSTGPFIPGRIVDLPREQFSAIADLSAGVVEVTVQRLQ